MAATQAGAPQPQGQPVDVDPISKFKMLVPRLKESLAGLMKVAGQVFHQGSQVDNCARTTDGSLQRFDKSLEEFYAICDQIELNLRIAIESNSQSIDSQKHTPVPVQGSLPKPVPSAADAQGGQQQQDQQPYTQYLTTVRTQVACAKEVHDALLECARKLSERQAQVAPQQQTS